MEVWIRQETGATVVLHPEHFQQELAVGRMPREIPVSVDAGRSWEPAWQMGMKLRARGDEFTALIAPVHTEAWSTVAGYIAVFSFLFFGGPIAFAAVVMAADHGPTKLFRLCVVLGALVLGPLPIAVPAALGMRALKKDPTLRGKGRAIFALIIAAVLGLACFVAAVVALLR